MPLYQYVCNNCHQETEDFWSIADMELRESNPIPCDECLIGTLSRTFHPKRHIKFHEGEYEHIGLNPLQISNAQQLVDACRKEGKTSTYMLDMSSLFGVKSGRWV